MAHAQHTVTVETRGRGLYDITRDVRAFCRDADVGVGMLTVFCRHTSASLTIQENADPDVVRDLNDFFTALVPDDTSRYRHIAEGADDMPAHIRSALTDVSLSIPMQGGAPLLGTWQGVYLFEHRTHPHRRQVVLHAAGD